MQQPTQGFNFVPAYQTPGLPYVTSSSAVGIVHYAFPYVAQSVTVKNTSAVSGTIYVAFTRNGFSSGNRIALAIDESISADVRVKDLFISGTASSSHDLFATLTTIPSRMMPTLTGSLTPNSGSVSWIGIG